jgi:hypothetical protein
VFLLKQRHCPTATVKEKVKGTEQKTSMRQKKKLAVFKTIPKENQPKGPNITKQKCESERDEFKKKRAKSYGCYIALILLLPALIFI